MTGMAVQLSGSSATIGEVTQTHPSNQSPNLLPKIQAKLSTQSSVDSILKNLDLVLDISFLSTEEKNKQLSERLQTDLSSLKKGSERQIFANKINAFYNGLEPSKQERFLKLIPLSLVGIHSVNRVQEISRRWEKGEITDDQFHDIFSHVKNRIQKYAGSFMSSASPMLLEKILNFERHFLSYKVVLAGFNKIENPLNALQKLMMFGNWYKVNQDKIQPQNVAAKSFFDLLCMSKHLHDEMNKKGRDESAIFILAMTDSWIKEMSGEYFTAELLTQAIQDYNSAVKNQENKINNIKDKINEIAFLFRFNRAKNSLGKLIGPITDLMTLINWYESNKNTIRSSVVASNALRNSSLGLYWEMKKEKRNDLALLVLQLATSWMKKPS